MEKGKEKKVKDNREKGKRKIEKKRKQSETF